MSTFLPFRQRAALTCALALLTSFAARADEWTDWLDGMAGLSPQAALERLQQAPDNFRQKADYYYWLGVYTLKTGTPAQAIEHFEHALMLDPDHAGAWYDYGLAHCRTGDQASCSVILESARARFGPPPALKEVKQPFLMVSGEVRTHLGHSSNLNAGSQTDRIDLWLNGQTFPLLLAGTSLAQAATFGDAAVDLRLSPTDAPGLVANITVYQRRPLDNRDMVGDYRVLAGELSYAAAPDQRVGLQYYDMDDTRLGSLSVQGVWWQKQFAPRGTQTLLAIERRTPSSGLPSYYTLRAEGSTYFRRGLEGRAALESDQPDSERPGRSQKRLTLGLNLPLTIMDKGRLEIGGRWQGARDSDAYSPFFGNERRKIQAWESRLRFNWPLAPQIDLRSEARYTRQHSNLALFDFNERMITLGIAARF